MQINQAKFVISNTDLSKCPQDKRPEYAFIGRSNVGKSSLINMLAMRKKLAMTSSSPGKTRLINHFLMNEHWYLVDLPGYGYARTGKKTRQQFGELITEYMLDREQLTTVFVLIDLRHKPQKIDLEFMAWLGEEEVSFSIVFTKSDKLKKAVVAKNLQDYTQELTELWAELPPIFVTSAEKRLGKEELLDYIDGINQKLKLEAKR
jgi:GTP-binding protein